jgi:hypothetical protein
MDSSNHIQAVGRIGSLVKLLGTWSSSVGATIVLDIVMVDATIITDNLGLPAVSYLFLEHFSAPVLAL